MKSWNEQLDSLEAQFQSLGLDFPAPLEFGVGRRVKAEGDKGSKKSGWYICHEFRLDNGEKVIVGAIQNWKLGPAQKIEADFSGVSADEMARVRAQAENQKKLAEEETKKRQAEAAEKANSIWKKLPRDGHSQYLQKKKVPGYGVRYSRGAVVVPIFNIDGNLCNLQFIYPDGVKRFLTGGKKRGCFHKFGWVRGADVLIIVEGYATGASVHLSTGLPVAVAFDCGNLKPVALNIKKKYPKLKIIFAADNDNKTEGNPGVSKAAEAANLVGGYLVIPQFEAVA